MTQREQLISELQKGWLSNFKASLLMRSHNADRVIRDIRANPPVGYAFIERIETEPCYHKIFRLVAKVDRAVSVEYDGFKYVIF